MPSALNSALAAALAAGAVVAATAIGDTSDSASRAVAARAKPVLIAPTRAQAIEAAAALRDRANGELGRRLGVPADRLLAAERAIVARQLAEAVDHQVLSPDQRDALLACFDAPKACDRGALPVLGGGLPPGGVPLPVIVGAPPAGGPRPAIPAPPRAIPVPAPPPRSRAGLCDPVSRRPARSRRALRCAVPLFPGQATALAKELSLPEEKVAAAMRGTMRALAGDAPSGPAADPDGVPLGVPIQLFPFAVVPQLGFAWDVGPHPAPSRPRPRARTP